MQFTDEQVTEALEAAVAERGSDYVYDAKGGDCTYTEIDDDGNLCPSCLVGDVFFRLGVPLEDVRQHEGAMAPTVIRKLDIEVSGRVLNGLEDAQTTQDDGDSWGRARDAYYEQFNEKESE